ncbi:uncharacterized protein LOC113232697 isoform X2 [Hyposmocoma kahamanoa]|uniref:uncharacterized protein LOC113232697 isoform X2 n=1 Tax=Hyposmocoma kahamanoa TaxID=1477025 RepID=UPI000E6D90F4|nr:uncharacterized protein LOC113232697 isoform X2 [Hyposmocoma kahamanoa]
MSTAGRGRGYTGRHHLREPRPGGDPDLNEELEAVRTLAELSPRATDPAKIEQKEKKKEPEMEKEKPDEKKDREVKYHVSAEDDAVLKELLFVDEQYAPLLALLEQFSPGEDGIQFNRKLRNFESNVSTMCPDETRLQAAFATFRAAALVSSVTARKLAAVGSSFTRQQRQQLLRGALLNIVMQGTFAKLEVLERANPSFLINAANLMGDYFAEARLCNGNKVHILASPLLQYMRALLTSDDIRAHRSLATQLMQNGRELLSVLAQELDDLSISIRLRLLAPPPVSIIWLLLSADLCLNKFLPLPNTLQQFYASHLELTSDENYSEVSYGSWKKEKDGYRSDSSDLAEKEEKLKEEELLMNTPIQNFSSVPEFQRFNNYPQENFVNYLQQGDGAYIQNQYTNNQNFTSQGDFVPQYQERFEKPFTPLPQEKEPETQFQTTQFQNERPLPERVNNEIQKSRRPVENWRKEKGDANEDPNRNRSKNWTRQRSKDNIEEDEEKKDGEKFKSRSSRPLNRVNRRNSADTDSGTNGGNSKTPPRRHVTEVPRNHKYWDHDDRCDKDYNS